MSAYPDLMLLLLLRMLIAEHRALCIAFAAILIRSLPQPYKSSSFAESVQSSEARAANK